MDRATLDEDWIKLGTWDVRNPDGSLVTTLEDYCYPNVPTDEDVRAFMALPSWYAAPLTLRLAAVRFLVSHPPNPNPLTARQVTWNNGVITYEATCYDCGGHVWFGKDQGWRHDTDEKTNERFARYEDAPAVVPAPVPTPVVISRVVLRYEDQPRDPDGRFGSGKENKPSKENDAAASADVPPTPAELGLNDTSAKYDMYTPTGATWTGGTPMTEQSLTAMYKEIPQGKSFAFNPHDGSVPTTGFTVGSAREVELTQPHVEVGEPGATPSSEFGVMAMAQIAARPDVSLWQGRMGADGNIVLQPAEVIENPYQAAQSGVERNSVSITDNAAAASDAKALDTATQAGTPPPDPTSNAVFTYGTGKADQLNPAFMPPLITEKEAAGHNSEAVSLQQFRDLQQQGYTTLNAALANQTGTQAFDSPQQWDQVKSSALDSVTRPADLPASKEFWVGQTIDPRTGEVINPTVGYAVTVRMPGQNTITVKDGDTDGFNLAMDQAKEQFAPQLHGDGMYLGVFHNDADKTVEIDPVMWETDVDKVDAVGSYTGASGGAFDFGKPPDTDDHWIPHVETGRMDTGKAGDGPASVTGETNMTTLAAYSPELQDRMAEQALNGTAKDKDSPTGQSLPANIGDGTVAGAVQAISDNYLAAANISTAQQYAAAITWYGRANIEAGNISKDSGTTLNQGAGMVAAMSPQNQYVTNVAGARFVAENLSANTLVNLPQEVIDAKAADGVIIQNGVGFRDQVDSHATAVALSETAKAADLKCNPIYGTKKDGDPYKMNLSLTGNVEKAVDIFNGANPRDVLGGSKVTSFDNNMVNPNPAAPIADQDVTIDGWEASIAGGAGVYGSKAGNGVPYGEILLKSTPGDVKQNSDACYPLLADGLRDAAQRFADTNGVAMTGPAFQALTWGTTQDASGSRSGNNPYQEGVYVVPK